MSINATQLLVSLLLRGTQQGPQGAQGPAGIVDTNALTSLLLNEDLTAQVNGVATVFTVSIGGKPARFVDAYALVFVGGIEVTSSCTLDGNNAQLTLTGPGAAPLTVGDLNGGALRLVAVRF